MSGISTHVLDTALGRPAAEVPVSLYRNGVLIAQQTTNRDGRCPALLPVTETLLTGVYELVFAVERYAADAFFPELKVSFRVSDPTTHHHVPLLLSPFGYSVYRGS